MKEINIYGVLNNATTDGVIAKAEQIQDSTQGKKQSDINADYKERIETLESGGGTGSGGTTDYTDLTNKPQINGHELSGNKSSKDLGLQQAGDYALKSEIPDTGKFATKEELNNITPTIGENGNWFINGEDTGKPAKGMDGADGVSLGEIALVQEPGTESGSENKVMSQKAVSEELTELDNKINLNGNLVMLGSQVFELGSSVSKRYSLPNMIVDKKYAFVLKSSNKITANLFRVRINNKTIVDITNIINFDSGYIIEYTPSSSDLKNNNQSNVMDVDIYNSESEMTADLYILYTAKEELDSVIEKNNTLVKANVVDIVLEERHFANKVNASMTTGVVSPTNSSNNNRCTTFLKLGTSKDILVASSTNSFSIVCFDKDKIYKYFIFNSTSISESNYYKFTDDIEYIIINGGNTESKCPIGTIIYNVPVEYMCNNINSLQKLEACPFKVFNYNEFFNSTGKEVETYASEPTDNASCSSRINLDVSDYEGIQSSNRNLNPVFEYDVKGNCVASHCYQSGTDEWYARGAIKFNPETAYITVVGNNNYKTNIILYKKPSHRIYVSPIDNAKYSRDSRMTEWKVFGDSTSDEGWAGTEVDYWTMASRILGLQAENMAKAASSFLPFKGSGSVAGETNTAIYDKTKLLSDFAGLITILGSTNDYNGGWSGAVWAPTDSEDRASKLMLTQENGKDLFNELSVKKFDDLLNIDELLADHNNHYFEEAFLYTMWDLKIRNPKALIICISPFGRIGEEYPNIVGATLQDYRNSEKRICQLLGIPYLDVQDVVGGINHTFYFNDAESETSAAEGLHPSADGHKITAAWLTVKLRTYIDMWELMNNGYIDTAYWQGKNTTSSSNSMFVKENFELKDYTSRITW